MLRTHKIRHQLGLSIIELLVGVAIGLLILSGAVKLFTDNITSNRKLVLETRVNQDMRSAADLIARDLRRAGFWGNSTSGVVTTNSQPTAATSPYSAVSPTSTTASTEVTYNYSQGTENNVLDATNESFGFKLDSANGVLQYQQGNNWQSITDRDTLRISSFSVTPVIKCVALQQYCTGGSSSSCATCALNAMTGCPTTTCDNKCPFLALRSYNIALQGTSATDIAVVRNLQQTVRVRNDQLIGVCP